VLRGPLNIHLAAHADDFEGKVVSVEFFAGNQSLGVSSNAISPFPLPAPNEAGFEDSNLTDPFTAPMFDPNSPALRADNALSIPLLPYSMIWSNAPVGDHVLTVVATDDQGATSTSSAKQIKIIPDTSLPRVEIFARDPVAAETNSTNQQNSATFVIHRTGSTAAELNVELQISGSAELGMDYTGVATTVTLPVGVRRTEITILPIDDTLVEGREFIQLQLLPTACIEILPRPPGCFDLGCHSRARAWIRDNDEVVTNRPPIVQILNPHHHTTLVEPERVLLVAAARDNDGTVQSVEFFDGDDSIGVVTVPNLLLPDATGAANLTVLPPWHLEWTNIAPGIHIIRAKAIDNEGAETTSRPVEVRVVSREELPVVQIETIDAVAEEPGLGNGIPQPAIDGTAGNPAIGGANPFNGATTPEGSLITGFAGTDATAGGAPLVLNTAAFRVVRSGDTTEPLTVYVHLGGHARNGFDYHTVARQVTIPAGQSAATITILPIDDVLPEGPEDVLVTIVHPDFRVAIPGLTTRDYIIGPNNQAAAVIRDNDGATENRPPEARILRPSMGAILPAGEPVQIMGHAVDVDGYLVQFAAIVDGQVVAEENINYFDAPPPGMRATFSLTWRNPTPGNHTVRVRARDNEGEVDLSDPITIRVISVTQPTVVTVEAADPDAEEAPNITNAAGVNPGAYVVRRRGGDLSQNLHVSYFMSGSALNGVDYHRLNGDVIFAPNEVEKRILLMPIDDDRVEPTETATLTIVSQPTIAIFPPPPLSYIIGEENRATVRIRDNDENRNRAPRVVVASPHRQQRFTAPADIEIVVHTRDVDGWVSQLEFFAGTNKLGDSVVHFIQPPEPGHRQRFSLNWTNVPPDDYAIRARATDNLGASSWSDPVPVLVRETNSLPIINIFARDFIAQEGANSNGIIDTATFVVERRGNTNESLLVFLGINGRAQNGTDYQTIADTVTIPAGETRATITITPIDDTETEAPESVVLSLIIPPNLRLAYEFGLNTRAAAVIGDNDFILPPLPGVPNQPMADALDDGVVHVVLRADTQEEVVVEGSDNLIDWFEIVRGLLTDGKIDFVEPNALNRPGRYYRVLPANVEAAPVAAQRRF
ncbi:MAG: Calx-beta domain-containing protein, partial [Limisphaerales bacterium]